MLRIEQLHLENFRCFDTLDVTFESDLTVLFAENGGGKSALLNALAILLSLLQPPDPNGWMLVPPRDVRYIRGAGGRREPAGPCRISCIATIGAQADVEWNVQASPNSRAHKMEIIAATEAIEAVRTPGAHWPLLAYYGTSRLAEQTIVDALLPSFQNRSDGYLKFLQPVTKDVPLLHFLKLEVLGDLVRQRRGETERRFDLAVTDAIQRATPGVKEIHYDPALDCPVVTFDEGHEATWSELSDGFHVYMGLVGDIARRAVILNGQDGADAPAKIEGVVLIDEIDLHLHPRWQRVVLHGLRAAFPKLQFIVTTHSPQVLSSAENRQVRRLEQWSLVEHDVFVEGKDTNAILREQMDTDDRDERGTLPLRAFYDALDAGRKDDARKLLDKLHERWGALDPEVIRAETLLREEA